MNKRTLLQVSFDGRRDTSVVVDARRNAQRFMNASRNAYTIETCMHYQKRWNKQTENIRIQQYAPTECDTKHDSYIVFSHKLLRPPSRSILIIYSTHKNKEKLPFTARSTGKKNKKHMYVTLSIAFDGHSLRGSRHVRRKGYKNTSAHVLPPLYGTGTQLIAAITYRYIPTPPTLRA